ncbi:MAG: Crp/Fnr family transcriptional regulator [Faecalibacterium sp.]|nr:Crp/Fnr family transcriptional regulator [Faecalibacterium sp.]
MQEYHALLKRTTLFAGIDDAGLDRLLSCLAPSCRNFSKGEALLHAGQSAGQVGVVVAGAIEAYRIAPDGTRILVSRMGPGGVFGDVLGGSSLTSPVTVVATEPVSVLFFAYHQLLVQCRNNCPAHTQLLQNLVRTISDKYFVLSRRVDLLLLKNLRAKVSSFLLSEAKRTGTATFTVPFTRAQLAEYLNCDRSALSRELSRMQAEGLIETYKSSFKLLDSTTLAHLSSQ